MSLNRKLHKNINDVEHKHCYACDNWLLLENFNKNSYVWDGLDRKCRSCCKLYRDMNRNKINTRQREYRENHKDERKQWLEQNKNHVEAYNKEYGKKYRKKNVEKLKQQQKEHYQKNKEKINAARLKKKRNDPQLRLVQNLRSRINKALTYGIKSQKTMELLGCTADELKNHLEKQFESGMSWENYGLYGWHVDHIKPCCKFNFTDPEEQRKCFHYSNLQPLWAEDNLRKNRF